ncbi:MAG: glycosyltransferase family 2 protein [Candidatus Binatia bacterium]
MINDVSIIIPCCNEERFIGECLDSIIGNEYPKDQLEVVVVDGMSEDGTRAIVEGYARRHAFIKLLDNPKKIIPAAMNIGSRHVRGEIIMKIDAHSTYERKYISKCVRFLTEYHADNVGGIWKIMPGGDTTVAKAIALALAHPFGSGNARIKIGSKKPRWADTAAFGCYRKEVFRKIGVWNEELAGSSDMDFNTRLKEAGGRILLVPEIAINYYADANVRAFWRHNFADGVWATYVLKFRSKASSSRHWIPLAFVSSLIGSAALSAGLPGFRWVFGSITGAYALANFGASVHIAMRERHLPYLVTMPIVFATRHMGHGLGALWGLVLALMSGKHWKGRRSRDV